MRPDDDDGAVVMMTPVHNGWLVVSGIYELCSLTQSRLSHSLLYGGGNQLEDGDGEDDDDNDDIVMIIERKHCKKRQ